ncbi:urate hydroxylase PuuD [Croceicoccus naphthovorans]|uniref:Membrane protein n=1 Tax=Croceicoccus naphthovorans TaxID=1348774 RepID=A0A0G3XMD5_9SPHN|nr:urate hydroxylase PuuD [Croceicoccus naphthovorans]AKM11811.1 membrane protein [Croceicoccus naphthovorans]MBB3988793.1 putative membrane protein [Croceicoccus naphthovorans]
MAKLFGNLHLVLAIGLIAAIALMIAFAPSAPIDINSISRWLHLFFGVLWIGLLYYLNFVQVPTMPAIPAEQKGAISGHIAPKVLFFFRWAAALTVLTGLTIAMVSGYLVEALTFSGEGSVLLIGVGMWLALLMAFNVWFIIWPAQKKILGIVEASDEAKAAAAPRALIASRLNTLLSLPMMWAMVTANLG